MRIQITDARIDGKPAMTAYWGTEMPAGQLAPHSLQQGAMWLYLLDIENQVVLPSTDWESYLSHAGQLVFYTDAPTLKEMKQELCRIGAIAGMMNIFIIPVPETLEHLLWLRDGEYLVYRRHELAVPQVLRVMFGPKDDGSWGIVLQDQILDLTLPTTPTNLELLYRAQISCLDEQTGPMVQFTTDGLLRHNVTAWKVLVTGTGLDSDNEVVTALYNVTETLSIVNHGQYEAFLRAFETIQDDEDRNPFEVAWGQVKQVNGNFGWAQRLQAERIRTESWPLPPGMFKLLEDKNGDVLLLLLNEGMVPKIGGAVVVDTSPHMVGYLLEQADDGSARTRLDAFSAELGFELVLANLWNHQVPEYKQVTAA